MIAIKKEAGGWVADCEQASNSLEVFDLFGGFVIPTPYPSTVDGETVRAAIQARNPDEEVVIIE